MRVRILAVALAVVIAAPAVAQETKSKKRVAKPKAQAAQQANPNEASWRLVKGAFPIILPAWSMPFYMRMYGEKAYQEEQQWQQQQRRRAKSAR